MKAWVLHGIDDIRLEEVEKPSLMGREVLIQVKAVGICGSDIPRIYETGAHIHPLIPGHEFSGLVVETGTEVPEKWREKRVGVFPLIPCRECLPCQRKQYEMCRNYSYLGSRRDGGFAEYVAAPVDNLLELPSDVSYEEAAMLEPMAVAVHAIRRVSPKPDDTVAVCGLGTIGLFIVMFLREMGIKNIFAIGNKDFQKQMILKLGISEECYFDARKGDAGAWIMECTGGIGADVFFECVGKNTTFSIAVDHAAPAGRVCLVGNPYSDMRLEKSVYWKILRNQLTVSGTWNSSYLGEGSYMYQEDDWHYVLKKLADKKISPVDMITHCFPLEELERGFHIMRDKTEDYVKIMAAGWRESMRVF